MKIHRSLYPPIDVDLNDNVHNHLFNRPEQKLWPNYTAYIDYDTQERRSYYQFLERTHDAVTGMGTDVSLGGLGLGAEGPEMVGILSENCMDWPVLVNALLALTAPFSLLSFYSTKFELSHGMRLSKLTRLFVHPNALPLALEVARELDLSEERIYVLGGSVPGRRSLDDIIRLVRTKKLPRVGVRPAQRDTLAYLVFSSGTSGLPKGVKISHGNIIFSLYQCGSAVQEAGKLAPSAPLKTLEGIATGLGFMPMYHSFGLHTICFRTFLAPTTQVILAKWRVEACLDAIHRYRISHLSLIPSVVYQVLNHPNIEKCDLSAVVSTTCGAAHLPPSMNEKLAGYLPSGTSVSEGYGMSEITITAMANAAYGQWDGHVDPVPGSAGILWAGVEARLVREDGTDAAVGEVGELYMRGGNTSLGYWDNEKATQETFVDGWVRSGDLFRVDANGRFFFVERAKDTLKISGTQVSPAEIEDVLIAMPSKVITDIAVAGVHGHGRTSDETVPRAWITLSEKGKQLEATNPGAVIKQLDKWACANLSKFKWLRGGYEIVQEIPKSPTGKTLRRTLQEQYEKRRRNSSHSKL